MQEALQALDQALVLHRGRGDTVAEGRVLSRLALVLHRLGDARSEEAIIESVELLEQQPAGPELVDRVRLLGRAPRAHWASDPGGRGR